MKILKVRLDDTATSASVTATALDGRGEFLVALKKSKGGCDARTAPGDWRINAVTQS